MLRHVSTESLYVPLSALRLCRVVNCSLIVLMPTAHCPIMLAFSGTKFKEYEKPNPASSALPPLFLDPSSENILARVYCRTQYTGYQPSAECNIISDRTTVRPPSGTHAIYPQGCASPKHA